MIAYLKRLFAKPAPVKPFAQAEKPKAEPTYYVSPDRFKPPAVVHRDKGPEMPYAHQYTHDCKPEPDYFVLKEPK